MIQPYGKVLIAAALVTVVTPVLAMKQRDMQLAKAAPAKATTAVAMFDNTAGDGVKADSTLPINGELQVGGNFPAGGQFLFSPPASGKNKRSLTFIYPSSTFVATPCDPATFLTNPSGPAGATVAGAWFITRGLTQLQIGEARAVIFKYGTSGGEFAWMGETRIDHPCTDFVAAYRVDQRTWRVATSLDRLNIPTDGAYHGVVDGQLYEGGCRLELGCAPPLLVSPGSQTVFNAFPFPTFDRHYRMPFGLTIYCQTCAPPPPCATWPAPQQPCQFWVN